MEHTDEWISANKTSTSYAGYKMGRKITFQNRDFDAATKVAGVEHMGSGGSKTPHDRSADALRAARNESAAAIQPSEGQGTGGRRHLLASRKFRFAPFDHRGKAFAGIGHAG